MSGDMDHLPKSLTDSESMIDLKGLLCPLPVFKTRKALQALRVGEVLQVIISDPVATIDIPHFCAEQGHEILEQSQQGEALLFKIKRGR